MNKEQIEQAAKEFVELQNRLNVIRTPQYYYRAGAEMVNEKQPYNKSDIFSIVNVVLKSIEEFMKTLKPIPFTNGYELIKLWEESKNG